MNVIIKINGREAIPVRALPLLAKWGTMHPQKIAGALGRVTDDDGWPLFELLHDMNAFYVEAGTVSLVESHHWRDHIYRKLQALSETIKHSEITRETGHSEWRVKALGVLPKDAFVWRDEYELIYDGTYGIGSRTKESGDTHTPPVMSKGKPPVALNFNPLVEDDMQPFVQAALDAIGNATNDVTVNAGEQQSNEANTLQQVALVPPASTMAKVAAQITTTPAPVVTASDDSAPLTAPAWNLITSLTRAPGYRWPLYQFLKAAHTAGNPCPKAREVLEGWKSNTPPELEVMTDGVKYSDALGNTKEANLKAIQQAIKGLLKK